MKEQVTHGSTSNNEAKYDVLISGLKICLAQKIRRLMVKGDALLIVKQILGIWVCKNERLRTKVTSIRKLFSQFEKVQLYHIPRKDNEVRHEKYTVCDGYSGYFQIHIAEEDQKKTTFITPWGCYAFWVMSFGLTNAPATFQRFMNHVFQAFFGKSIKVYIDDFCIYSSKALHVQKVEEGLQRLNGFGGQLNPDKCHIGEDEVILFGHKISQIGIEVDPAKAKALLELPSPKNIKGVMSFMQKVKYMARFIHLASELLHPLQKLTQEVEFAWSEDLEEYFKSIKVVLSELPTLMPRCWDFPFFVNPSVGAKSIGAILLQQDPQSNRMRPVYFTSRVTTNIEKGYSEAELMMLSLIFAVRKFRSYLLTKPFVILTSKILLPWVSFQMTMSPRISKWLMELQSYEYTFKVENSVRAQLARILTYQLHEKVIKVPNVRPLPPPPPKALSNVYTLFFDGAFRRAIGKAGGGLVLVNPKGEVVMKEQVALDGSTSNNEAKYDVLISGLKICLAQKIRRLMVKGDALLIVKQILVITNGPFEKWGIDAMGPLPRTANGKLYILVAIDYMTRWVEAQSVARVNEKTVSKFVYTHICCRFGTPLEIVLIMVQGLEEVF
ncbi:hypothetical protein L7F22_062094 [Adiantum nelumboides]|nr:hypothetical protein [Adiantum nelumboides]